MPTATNSAALTATSHQLAAPSASPPPTQPLRTDVLRRGAHSCSPRGEGTITPWPGVPAPATGPQMPGPAAQPALAQLGGGPGRKPGSQAESADSTASALHYAAPCCPHLHAGEFYVRRGVPGFSRKLRCGPHSGGDGSGCPSGGLEPLHAGLGLYAPPTPPESSSVCGDVQPGQTLL